MISSGVTTSIILFIIATANILAWVLASQQVPQRLSAFFLSLGTNPYLVLFFVNIFLFIVGMFMETGAAVILLSPDSSPGPGFPRSPSACMWDWCLFSTSPSA